MKKSWKFLYLFFAVTVVSGLLISGCGHNTEEIGKYLMGGTIQGQALNSGGVVSTFAGSPNQVGSEDGFGAGPRFNRPYDITTDGTNLYVTDRDNHTIRQIVIDTGEITTLAGTAGSSGSTNDTGALARFNQPTGITTDGTNLYVAEKENHTIRKIVIATKVVTTLAGSGASGFANGTGTAATFNQPYGITTDGTNLFVTDRNNHTIRQIVIATGEVTTLAGTALSWGIADGLGAIARFNEPRGLTTDGTNLYVTDWNNHTIRKIVIATGDVTTFAGDNTTSGDDDGIGTLAKFYRPRGITSDGTNLYVADYWNNTIRKIVISTATVSTLAASATAGFGFADGTGEDASFDEPSGITTDGISLYVTDNANETIRKID
ncbi:MAG: hypothetical protein Q7U10_03955 [Thermodesulfovibrionia bacterium]|nr:hypothetical protein [Thermodesulfovibrionia bacterium]